MLDATDGVTEQDMHIAGYILEARRSLVIIVNKWDALEKDSTTMQTFDRTLRAKFDFIEYAPIVYISALTGQRIHQVLETAKAVWEARHHRIPTSQINRILRDAQVKHPAPARGGKRLKMYFASQVATAPPLFLFHVNDPTLVHFTYRRFLENQIRAEYPFTGTPMRLSFRARSSDE